MSQATFSLATLAPAMPEIVLLTLASALLIIDAFLAENERYISYWLTQVTLLGTIKVSFWYAFLAATTLIFGAAYTLWMTKRVIYGAVANEDVAELKDVGRRELTFLVLLAVAVLAMGIYPKPFSDVMNPSIDGLLKHVAESKLR